MLKVTIELYPHGYVEGKKKLGEMLIINDGTGSYKEGNYNIIARNIIEKQMKTGKVKNFKRIEDDLLKLLFLAVKSVLRKKWRKNK